MLSVHSHASLFNFFYIVVAISFIVALTMIRFGYELYLETRCHRISIWDLLTIVNRPTLLCDYFSWWEWMPVPSAHRRHSPTRPMPWWSTSMEAPMLMAPAPTTLESCWHNKGSVWSPLTTVWDCWVSHCVCMWSQLTTAGTTRWVIVCVVTINYRLGLLGESLCVHVVTINYCWDY